MATISGSRLTIRDVNTIEIRHVFPCVDKIDKVVFSPDSQYVFCAMFSRNAVQIFCIADGEWRCRINEGVAGITNVFWSPDSRGIVTESDFGLQLSVWSLVDSSSHLISSPKAQLPHAPPVQVTSSPVSISRAPLLQSFSDCSRFLAVIHRLEGHDHIGIYTTAPWGEVNKFKGKSNDVAAVCWSSDGVHILTVDSPLTYKVNVYNIQGTHVANFEAYKHSLGIRNIVFHRLGTDERNFVSNRLQKIAREDVFYDTLQSEKHSLSIKEQSELKNYSNQLDIGMNPDYFQRKFTSVHVHPQELVALGSYDGKIRLLSTSSWKCAYVLPLVHPNQMEPGLNGDIIPLIELTAAQMKASNAKLGTHAVLDTEIDDPAVKMLEAMTKSSKKDRTNLSNGIGACYIKKAIKKLPSRALTKKQIATAGNGPPRAGVVWAGWSADGALLAAREETQPQCLWIWDAINARLVSLLVQLDDITCARWRPLITTKQTDNDGMGDGSIAGNVAKKCDSSTTLHDALSILAFCTGTSRIYFYSPDCGPSWADLPNISESGTPLVANSLSWSDDGSKLVVQGRESITTCTVWIDSKNNAGGTIIGDEVSDDSSSSPKHSIRITSV